MKSTLRPGRIVLAAFVFVGMLEFSARLDDYVVYGAPFLGVYTDASLYEYDQLGKHGKPFGHFRKWQLNELGYRGPRIEQDRIHIVCFGASETFGLYESEGQEYPRQLELELNARAGRAAYQVVNVAYPGQMLPTATQRVPQVVARVHPKLALIYVTPTFYIDMPAARPLRPTHADPLPAVECRMADRLQNAAKAVLPGAVQTWMRQWQIEREMGSTKAMIRLPDETITRFGADLTEMLATSRANGVDPVIVTHATVFGAVPSQPDHQLLVAWRKFHPTLGEDGFLDAERRMNQAMREVAEAQHVQLIDIARDMPPDRAYFADYQHFTDAGSALMAKRLADGLEPLLEPSKAALRSSPSGTTAQTLRQNAVTR